jgi:isoprenylcysteine carboxyl methyltransferase (ICMT) family protein YpbQ
LFLLLGFGVALMFRLWTLVISRRHEKVLMAHGAVEYDVKNSNALAIIHALFYFFAIIEGELRRTGLDSIALIGMSLYLAGGILLLIVMRLLGPLWTVRLIIANGHVLVRHWLFRKLRHPNYYIAIIPELLGLSLYMHAWYTLGIGGALYALPLYRRIQQENAVMAAGFPDYE